jgi:hypothetical protein
MKSSELARLKLDEKKARRILDSHHLTELPPLEAALAALGSTGTPGQNCAVSFSIGSSRVGVSGGGVEMGARRH